MGDTSGGTPTPPHFPTLYVFISIVSGEICDLKEAINVWHEPALTVFGATLHISCLSSANSPWVMMKRFTKQKGRERYTKRDRGRDR